MTNCKLEMTKLKLGKLGIVTGLIVIGVATPILMQRQTNQRLVREIEQLHRQADASARENETAAQRAMAADELTKLRSEHAELLRLRGEVTSLRQQIKAKLVSRSPSPPSPAPAEPQLHSNVYWNADSWRDAGTSTPDAALQTLLWSAKSGDPQLVKSLIYWDGQVDPVHLADWETGVSNTVQSYLQAVTNCHGIRLISQVDVDADTKSLRFDAISSDGSTVPTDLTFRKTDKGWRQVIAVQ